MARSGPSDLWVSPDLRLPLTVATEALGILGQRGSGKSNTAVVLAEEMFAAGIPWVAVDPKSDWWGIRSSEDGTGAGLPIPVFGGLHGDVPLEAAAGRYVADLLVSETLTAVLDVSHFSKGDRGRFLVDFFEQLLHRHRLEPHARHVILEEAHSYIPQQVTSQTARLKEAAATVVLEGRSFGLGASAVSQRPARLHKDVLTQVSTLVIHRLPSPQDRAAVKAWVEEHDVDLGLVASLSELASGEAWVWSPQFLGIVERVTFRRRRTFDSGSTPIIGTATRPPATLADVDLAAIKEAMAETIERAQADDPRALRARVRQLEDQLAQAELTQAPPEIVEVEVPVLTEDLLVRLEEVLRPVGAVLAEIGERLTWDVTQTAEAMTFRRGLRSPDPALPPAHVIAPKPARASNRVSDAHESKALSKAEKAILTVLAQFPAGRTKRQIAMLAGYSSKGGGFGNAVSSLRTQDLIEGKDPLKATLAGLDALGTWTPLPRGPALLAHWLAQCSKAEKAILSALVDAYPNTVTKLDLGARTGYEPSGGGFNNALSRLRTLELIDRGEPRAADDFMAAIR